MRRNHLELRLAVPPPHFTFSGHDQNSGEGEDLILKEKQKEQLTIFYDGKVSVCDVTEHQAMTILKVANEAMQDEKWSRRDQPAASSPIPLVSPSMKKSLQTFLQKRNHRIQSTSPYPT